MNIDKEHFDAWMERIMEQLAKIIKLLDRILTRRSVLSGQQLLDNQDLCRLLNVSKRTLQRYRDSGELPYHTIYHKTYYRERDVQAFIRLNFEKRKKHLPPTPPKEGDVNSPLVTRNL
ncbi:MAG: helix-turn-helix domain-containing protein [Tannerellaceae bacterium]|jgi:hypothetical protein|nr:helix-turn-helix domain-containing protein [Tannerellaceae bacterium]